MQTAAEDKQLYQFTDHGGRQVGLRFDLTVPLARYTAQHFTELTFPFKRYHFGKEWRGENEKQSRNLYNIRKLCYDNVCRKYLERNQP